MKEEKGLPAIVITKLAKKLDFERELVKQVYEDMGGKGEYTHVIDKDILTKQLEWMKENEITTFEDYRAKITAIQKELQEKNEIKQPTNETESQELRKKLGYTNTEWRKVKYVEKHIAEQLKKLIVEFVAATIASGDKYDETNFKEHKSYVALETRWKNFARNYAIREYPKANTHKGIRTRIIALFETKLAQSLKEDTPAEEIKEEGLVEGEHTEE